MSNKDGVQALPGSGLAPQAPASGIAALLLARAPKEPLTWLSETFNHAVMASGLADMKTMLANGLRD